MTRDWDAIGWSPSEDEASDDGGTEGQEAAAKSAVVQPKTTSGRTKKEAPKEGSVTAAKSAVVQPKTTSGRTKKEAPKNAIVLPSTSSSTEDGKRKRPRHVRQHQKHKQSPPPQAAVLAKRNKAEPIESTQKSAAETEGQKKEAAAAGPKPQQKTKTTTKGEGSRRMNDDQFSLEEEEEGKEQQEDRKTPTKDVLGDHLKAILERIGELEKQQQQQTKAFLQSQNDQKNILEKISELEKQQQQQTKGEDKLTKNEIFRLFFGNCAIEHFSNPLIIENILTGNSRINTIRENLKTRPILRKNHSYNCNDQKKILEKIFSELEKQTKKMVFLKFQENCWDGFACHKDIEIIGDKSLSGHYCGNGNWRSVFAKYPILLNKSLSDFFYYEISVMKNNKNYWVTFGFADKQKAKLDGLIHCEKDTYAYDSLGEIWINGEGKGIDNQYSYGVGDTVGIGVHLATRQIIFTKNGLRLDTSDFLVAPSFADGSFYPFVSLFFPGFKIEANFGPNFKFDLANL